MHPGLEFDLGTKVALREPTNEEGEYRLLVVDKAGSGRVVSLSTDVSLLEFTVVDHTNISVIPEFTGVENFEVFSHDGFLYMLGGRIETLQTCSDRFRRCRPWSGCWEELAPMRTARCRFGLAITDDGHLVVSGGEKSDGKATKLCEIYDLKKNSWLVGSAGLLPSARKDHACATDGRTVFLSGGTCVENAQRNIWLFEDHRWQCTDDHYPARTTHQLSRHSMICMGDRIYFIGGITPKRQITPRALSGSEPSIDEQPPAKQRVLDRVESFTHTVRAVHGATPSECTLTDNHDMVSPWTWNYPRMLYPRHSCATVLLGPKIYLLGGTSAAGHSVQRVESFDVITHTWAVEFSLPEGDHRNVTAVLTTVHGSPSSDRTQQRHSALTNGTPIPMSDLGNWVLW